MRTWINFDMIGIQVLLKVGFGLAHDSVEDSGKILVQQSIILGRVLQCVIRQEHFFLD